MIKLKLLKNKNFTLLLLAGGISKLGNGMLNISLSLYILKITGSAGKFAFLIVLSMIPMLLLSPIGGVFADRIYNEPSMFDWQSSSINNIAKRNTSRPYGACAISYRNSCIFSLTNWTNYLGILI